MAESKESIIPADPGLRDETLELNQDELNLYKGIIYKDATALLARYLPEAFPQEPTEIFIGLSPFYIGKFRGKHYISLERGPQLDPMIQAMEKLLEDTKWQREQFILWADLEDERNRLVGAKAEKGEVDFDEIDQEIDRQQAIIKERQKPFNDKELQPHQDPEELLQGPSHYNSDTWRHIYSLVHELIHQRQAELNPSTFNYLTSPGLASINPDTIPEDQLVDLLIESHKAYNRTHKEDSLFYPVVEGMAALGAFYIMGKFVDELAGAGEGETANRLWEVRKGEIRNEVINPKRSERAGRGDNYSLYYPEGLDIMRKLYKAFGLQNVPQMLTTVDLAACQGIKRGSPEYQKITADPTQLPGLQTVA